MLKKINKIILINILIFSLGAFLLTKSSLILISVICGGIIILIDFFLIQRTIENLISHLLDNPKLAFLFVSTGFIVRMGLILVLILLCYKFLHINFLGLLVGISCLPISLMIGNAIKN